MKLHFLMHTDTFPLNYITQVKRIRFLKLNT